MKKLFCAAVLVVGLLGSSGASGKGSLNSIQDLMVACAPSSTDIPYCYGLHTGVAYVLAVINNSTELPGAARVCLPDGTSLGQMVQVFMNWAKANPTLWQGDAAGGVVTALGLAWPCPK
jgi:hypothetical protein